MDIFVSGKKKLRIQKYPDTCGRGLDQTSSTKFLGFTIDCHLSWQDHIDLIARKISRNINIMAKVKPLLGSQTLISLYYASIYPYLTNGCILWGNNYAAPLAEIVRPQNKAIRIISDDPLQEHITPHYVQLGLEISGYCKTQYLLVKARGGHH